MAKVLTPLSSQVPIVDKEGKPLPQFSRLLQSISVGGTLSVTNGTITAPRALPYIDGNGDGTVPNPGTWVLGEWRIMPASADPTKGSIIVEGPYNQGPLLGAQFQLDAAGQSSNVGVVWGSNTTWAHWYGLGALSANNRYYLYGDKAFEFDTTPYVNTNKIFNEGNLSFSTGLNYNAGTGVLKTTGAGLVNAANDAAAAAAGVAVAEFYRNGSVVMVRVV